MPALDVIKDIRSSLDPGLVLSSVHPLALEDAKETFGRGVVGTTAPGSMVALVCAETVARKLCVVHRMLPGYVSYAAFLP